MFFLLAAILALLAAFVMLVSQRAVTSTVYQTEARGTTNVLDLVAADVRERYSQLLREKIVSIRGYRARLQAHGAIVEDTLATFAQLADESALGPIGARALALDWLRRLGENDGMEVFVYDRSLRVLAAESDAMRGASLAGLRDVKGEVFAPLLFARPGAERFAVYGWPPGAQEASTQLGYFRHVPAWDWVVAVTLPADAVEAALAAKRGEIADAVNTTAQRLTLARSGFLFVFDDAGRLIAPPPAHGRALLGAADTPDGLLARIRAAATDAPLNQMPFSPPGDPNEVWEISATHVKALGWYVASAVPRSDLVAPARALLRQQGLVFLIALAIALALAWVFASRLVRPLNLLTAYARELPDGELTEPRPVPPAIAALPERHRDEVGRLARTILFMERSLHANVQRLMRQTSERERIESELSIARDIQLGLLPLKLEPHVTRHTDLFASMTAAKEVGGDLYDYFMLEDGRLCFVIGDVSGKGVPAALFMAITRTVIRSAAGQANRPGALMQMINDRLAENNPNLMFVTLFLGMLDLKTGALAYANAGHPPPWLIENSRVRLLTGRSGPACGIAPEWTYEEFATQLSPAALLMGYTDGITDAESTQGALYGDERPACLLAALPENTGSEAAIRALLEDVLRFAQDAEQADDITLIALRHLIPPEDAP
ncbi:SpoIIE family protein phosphatase [Achromobacter sp. GG226]|uniref:SpoIIE family protein phosphatase n=1 Tax=Verticiella alkaliphila TaxID=2779529 RepID=UPI001C0D94F1|nr:SpoIIE family protein phosphatase [Verticiella sp. GG226]